MFDATNKFRSWWETGGWSMSRLSGNRLAIGTCYGVVQLFDLASLEPVGGIRVTVSYKPLSREIGRDSLGI